MTNKIKQIDGYWVIGTNKWRVVNYTKEEAELACLKKLIEIVKEKNNEQQ